MTNQNTQAEDNVKIHRAKCDSLKIYEVTEGELVTIERGSPNSVFLNFAIFFLSIAIAFLITLLTVKIDSDRLFTIFVVVCVLGFMVGFVLLFLWYKNNNEFSDTIDKIKARLKEEEEEEEELESNPNLSAEDDPTTKEV